MLVFVLACIAGYFVVRAAVTNTIEHQAVAIADIVASQATTARSVYASQIAEKLRLDGYGPSVDSDKRPGHVPIPAQFLKLVGRASSDNADRLYQYKPVSKWNLEATQGLTDDFLRWAWPQLESQDRDHSDRPIAWVPVYRFEEQMVNASYATWQQTRRPSSRACSVTTPMSNCPRRWPDGPATALKSKNSGA